MATAIPPHGHQDTNPSGDNPGEASTWDVELLRVLVSRKGTHVDAQWAIHPQLKHDLQPDEWKEVNELMAQVTTLVGNRFSQVLSQVEPDPPGHA